MKSFLTVLSVPFPHPTLEFQSQVSKGFKESIYSLAHFFSDVKAWKTVSELIQASAKLERYSPEIHLEELPTSGQCNPPFRDWEQEMATRLEN